MFKIIALIVMIVGGQPQATNMKIDRNDLAFDTVEECIDYLKVMRARTTSSSWII
jgi:hypothetical protein